MVTTAPIEISGYFAAEESDNAAPVLNAKPESLLLDPAKTAVIVVDL